MSKEKQHTFSTVLSANPYRGDYYIGTLNTITESKSPSFSKDQYAVSFLNTKSFISTVINISKNIPEDDIYDALETKVYEELALDMAVEYQIRYLEAFHQGDGNERHFNVFIVDPLNLEEEYIPIIDAIKYIDEVVPVPLLLKTLYTKNFITSSDIHCFIYFQENDAFFALYNEQDFLYTKSLKYSLKQIHERFCELLGEQIDLSTFETMLATNGLNTSDPEYQKHLIKLFGEIFLHINDVLTYSKRAFEIKKIDQIFIGAAVGSLLGLDEYAQTYLGIRTVPFEFDYGFNTNGKTIDQIHQLMQLYARLDSDEKYDCNFTVFHRPPPFTKRDSGKLIIAVAASLAGALMYPGVYWGLSYVEEFHHALLSKEYEQVHIEKMEREAIINLKLANKTAAQTLLDEQTSAYKQKQDSLIQIHDKKVNYPMKAKLLADFTRSFNQYNVQLKTLGYAEDNLSKTFTFMLTAPKTQNVTALLKHLTDTKRDKYDFNLELISYNEDEKSYISELKAVLK